MQRGQQHVGSPAIDTTRSAAQLRACSTYHNLCASSEPFELFHFVHASVDWLHYQVVVLDKLFGFDVNLLSKLACRSHDQCNLTSRHDQCNLTSSHDQCNLATDMWCERRHSAVCERQSQREAAALTDWSGLSHLIFRTDTDTY